MSSLKGLYRVGRPFNAVSGALAVLLGGYVAGTGHWGNVGLAAVATFFVTAASNAWNDYLDIEIDRINQPQRPIPAGLITPRQALIFSIVCTSIALTIAVFINLPSFLIVFISLVILYIYSWKLKSTVLMGNATVAAISGASALFGGVAAGNVAPSLWLVAIIGVAIMMREVLKTMADYEGDLHRRVRTVATVWGKRVAYAIFSVLAIATMLVMILPFFFGVFRPIYVLIVAIGVYPMLLYVMSKVHWESTGRQLERLSQLIKLEFLVWFLAVLLGASV